MHAGLYVEGMESGEEDVAALERRWLKPIYTAAPKLVLRYALRATFVRIQLKWYRDTCLQVRWPHKVLL